ncbi:hypothetical protein [Bradyrhizobium sp. Leo121]|uniref:hypothetical protein n=1 Tax=Bradyrhizobium sp. Leo121 TaxID=1571195 RepID=UPI0010288B00|nr:hypothetical protein [Bradyrhizobium sp. Leo121]RZN30470.1 hypothetical protein CWO90_20245 [Bradyrhizobium sp. Leo121]
MPEYHVYGQVTGTKYLGKFTADTPEKAVEAAMEKMGGPVTLCHHCTAQVEDAQVVDATAEPAR